MSQEENLNRLENIVNNLLTKLDGVAAEKQQLAEQLRQVSDENVELKQEVARLREEKDQVRHRVSGIIDSIEQWEQKMTAQGAA